MTSSTRLVIIAMAFCLTAVVSSQAFVISPHGVIRHPIAMSPQNDLHFRFKSGGTGRTSDGADFSAVTYESSDGIIVSAITETYSSKRQAERALKKKLRGATKILNRGPKVAPTGKRVGIRIVARFRIGDRYPARATILWTDGSELHYVGSDSLKHVQEFEKTFYSGPRPSAGSY